MNPSQEAVPTLEEQIEKMVRARLNGLDVLGGQIPGREKHVRECDAIIASLQRLAAAERRYGFLRAGGIGTGLYVADSGNGWRQVNGDTLDSRIDTATGHIALHPQGVKP